MRALAARGFAQAVLPPHERPAPAGAARAGLRRQRRATSLARAAREAPRSSPACSSAAAMWIANAATVSPSADTADGRVHFTPANLASHFHRAIEAATTTRVLRAIFADAAPLRRPRPAACRAADRRRGRREPHAARGRRRRDPGVELFVYGRSAFDVGAARPRRFPARQTREACEAIARRHGLDPARVVFAQQHPRRDRRRRLPQRRDRRRPGPRAALPRARVRRHAARVLDDARAAHRRRRSRAIVVARRRASRSTTPSRPTSSTASCSTRADGAIAARRAAPSAASTRARRAVPRPPASPAAARSPRSLVFDLRQSMRNGGGPACLRLRVAAHARGTRGDPPARVPRRRARRRRSTPGSAATTAIACCPPTSPTRRCSTSRGARSTS